MGAKVYWASDEANGSSAHHAEPVRGAQSGPVSGRQIAVHELQAPGTTGMKWGFAIRVSSSSKAQAGRTTPILVSVIASSWLSPGPSGCFTELRNRSHP